MSFREDRLIELARSVRCAAGWTRCAVSTAVLGVGCIGTSYFDSDGRRAYGIGKAWAALNMFLMRCPVTTIGRERIDPRQPYVVMSNHRSHVDIWASFLALPLQLRWVMKSELRTIPVFGLACERMGHIYVERGNRDEARASMAEAARRIRAGTSVFFFPEGTRSRDGNLLPFKKGGFRLAIEAQAPVLPVSIFGTDRIMPAKQWKFRAAPVTVVIDEPIATTGMGAHDVPVLMDRTRDAIEAGLRAASAQHPIRR